MWPNATAIYDLVTRMDAKKYIMLLATPGSCDTTTITNGLAGNHAYTLLGTYVVRDVNGVETRLYLCRNPWGSDGAYNGTWRDADPIWLTNNYT